MSNKNERQLLITAYPKKDTGYVTFGYGLPYSVPIVNPVWVSMDKIVAAQAQGMLDIYVHNVEPPVLLTKELYSKFYDLGYIDKEIADTDPSAKVEIEDAKELEPTHETPTPPSPPEVEAEKQVTVKSIAEADKDFTNLADVSELLYEHDATEIVVGMQITNLDKKTKKDKVKFEIVRSDEEGTPLPVVKLSSKIIAEGKLAKFVGAYKVTVPAEAMVFSIKAKLDELTMNKEELGVHKNK